VRITDSNISSGFPSKSCRIKSSTTGNTGVKISDSQGLSPVFEVSPIASLASVPGSTNIRGAGTSKEVDDEFNDPAEVGDLLMVVSEAFRNVVLGSFGKPSARACIPSEVLGLLRL
jgi:hypothetical protein